MNNTKSPKHRADILTRRVTLHGRRGEKVQAEPGKWIRSIGTEVKVRGNVERFLRWLQERNIAERGITVAILEQFLTETAMRVSQKTLDGYRIALTKNPFQNEKSGRFKARQHMREQAMERKAS